MQQFWLVVGSEKNWKVSFENKNIWGLKGFRELLSLWNMLREGDGEGFRNLKEIILKNA